jgi:FkbM family methyltransferase
VAAFCDNNPVLQRTVLEGLPVLSPEDAVLRFGRETVFVVTIWRDVGGHPLDAVRRQMAGYGVSRVVSAAHLFWKHEQVFLPYYFLHRPDQVLRQTEQVKATFDLFTDETSRREYVAQVQWRIWLDFAGLGKPDHREHYFPPDLFLPRDDEVLIDAGAFQGDTLRNFLRLRGGAFRRYLACEPDPANIARLNEFIGGLDSELACRIRVVPLALSDMRGKVRFAASGTQNSAISETGELEVETAPLDALLGDDLPTHIKMDIEGAEPLALIGAEHSIRKSLPVLAISVYHQYDHLWRIPRQMQVFSERYRLFLRPHGEACWDLICYAVPVDRLLSGSH